MLKMLVQLRTSNKAAYEEAVRTLGLEAVAAALEEEIPEASSSGASIDSIQQLTESLSKMKEEQVSDALSGLKTGKEPQVKGVTITPSPGFSFKTLNESKKVFVNIVTHEAVGAPAMVKRLDAEGKEVEGLNVPMSVGPCHFELDNKDASCATYDIVVHPSVLEDCAKDKSGQQKDFLCQLGIQSIEQKFGLVLDRRYKLPKLAYMGDKPAPQFIKDRTAMPSIQEVKPQPASSSAAKAKPEAKKPVVVAADKEFELQAQWCGLRDASSSLDDLLAICASEGGALLSSSALLRWEGATFSKEYIEPLEHPPSVDGRPLALLVTTEISSHLATPAGLEVLISPFRLSVLCAEYRKCQVFFPISILPLQSYYKISPVEGFVSKKRIEIVLGIDYAEWEKEADAGSKPWLLAQALGDNNPYDSSSSRLPNSAHPAKGSQSMDDRLPEERFHLSLPADVDQYTGVKLDDAGEEVLPEDRFHQKDASSTFLINQRDQARKDKWAKHEKEKAERVNDPNVEYVEMSDYRPGGKYGPNLSSSAASSLQTATALSKELQQASQVLAQTEAIRPQGLSSTLWTELIE